MKNIFIVAVVALAGCTVSQPAPPAVTVTAPPVTVAPTPTEEVNEYQSILEGVWEETSYSERQDMCLAFTTYPQLSWKTFNNAASNTIPKKEFFAFFEKQCGY